MLDIQFVEQLQRLRLDEVDCRRQRCEKVCLDCQLLF